MKFKLILDYLESLRETESDRSRKRQREEEGEGEVRMHRKKHTQTRTRKHSREPAAWVFWNGAGRGTEASRDSKLLEQLSCYSEENGKL